MIRVTVDSNVYVSALVFGGKPMRLIELATEGAIQLTVSEPIIAETRRVLRTKFAWTDERADGAMETLRSIAEDIAPTETFDAVPRDLDDNACSNAQLRGALSSW